MYRHLAIAASVLLCAGVTPVAAAGCAGQPDALGTSRIIAVDPAGIRRVGTMQYPDTLPLRDHEIVLTFDDGPRPPHTARILDALRAECVKATFFMLGNMAKAHADLLQRAYTEGHTIATHSQRHRVLGQRATAAEVERDFESGAELVAAALGDRKAVAPFYRFPGLGRSPTLEQRRAASWYGALISKPTIGRVYRRTKSPRACWPVSVPKDGAFSCCTTFNRRPRGRCRSCCAHCEPAISASCMWYRRDPRPPASSNLDRQRDNRLSAAAGLIISRVPPARFLTSTLPSASPRGPIITCHGIPMRSAVANLPPARSSRSS
jgi:hypothetical protein